MATKKTQLTLFPQNNMATKKTTIKVKAPIKKVAKTKPKKSKGNSAKQKLSQAKIKRVSDLATAIQKKGGTKTTSKTVYKVNRSVAVKQAWNKLF